MRVFVLGTTGWIGGAMTDAFVQARHEVVGLARTEAAMAALRAKGADAVRGDMDNYEAFLSDVQQADATIVASSASLDATLRMLEALVAALQGTQKPLVYISGSSLYGEIGRQERVGEEVFMRRLGTPAMQHSPEYSVYRAKERGVHGMVIVGAGILYGRGGGATPAFWLDDARRRQAAWYIGDGQQRWSAVHVEDLARLTVLAVEQVPAERVFNAVADAPTLREMAELIAQATRVSGGAESISGREAQDAWGPFWARILSQNLWLSPTLAENTLGWRPTAPSFRDDLLSGSYTSNAS